MHYRIFTSRSGVSAIDGVFLRVAALLLCSAAFAQDRADVQWLAGGHYGMAAAIASTDGSMFVTAGTDSYPHDRTIKLWRTSDLRLIRTVGISTNAPDAIAFSGDGAVLAIRSGADVIIRRVPDATLIRTLTGIPGGLGLSHDGSILVTCSSQRGIEFWRTADGTVIQAITGSTAWGSAAVFSPDGTMLAVHQSSRIRVWRVSDGSLAYTLSNVARPVFSPDGAMLAVVGAANLIQLLHVSDGSEIRSIAGPAARLTSLVFSPDGLWIMASTMDLYEDDNSIRIWRVSDGELIRRLAEQPRYIRAACFGADGETVVSMTDDSRMKRWSVSSGALMAASDPCHTLFVERVAFSPDGGRLASADVFEVLRGWNVGDGALRYSTERGSCCYHLQDLDFSPDSEALVATMVGCIEDDPQCYEIRWYSARDGRESHRMMGDGQLGSLAFSPDGKTFATGGELIRIWDTSERTVLREFPTAGRAYCVSFSSDGAMLAAGTDYYGGFEIGIWRAADGALLQTLTGNSALTADLAWFDRDRQIVAASEDQTLRVWRVSDGSIVFQKAEPLAIRAVAAR